MGFQKGNKHGHKGAGVRDLKNQQWEQIGEYLTSEGSVKFLEELGALDGKDYLGAYKDILEYFKPKRAREDGKGNADTGTTVFISAEHKKEAKEAIAKYLDEQ